VGRGGIWEDMCYERRRAEACVDWAVHHALVNAGDKLAGFVTLAGWLGFNDIQVRLKIRKTQPTRTAF
jgi:hypothetical protein